MTTTESTAVDCTDIEPAVAPVVPRRARIDGPHPVVTCEPPETPASLGSPLLEVEEPSPDLVAAVAGLTPEARRQQLELQTEQLAEHLRERLREVDRREAQLNARMAQSEADLRTGRIALREQEHEFELREAELRRQLEDLQAQHTSQAEQLAPATDWDALRAELAEREHQCQVKENELRERRFEVDRLATALRHAQQLWEQQRTREENELVRSRERLAAELREQTRERQEELAAAEEQVASQAQQLERDRAELAHDRQTWEERRLRQEQILADRLQAAERHDQQQRERLAARAEWIERQKAGIEQVRGEITTIHRQSLEMRLLAEQLWAQISDRAAPAEIAQSIAGLRRKLAEHYQLEEQTLVAHKRELQELGERIAGQHRELVQLREGLRAWVSSRQAEIETQAAALLSREADLDGQLEALRHERQAWQAERHDYELRIRELSTRLRELPAA